MVHASSQSPSSSHEKDGFARSNTLDRLLALITRRHRIPQHLPNRLTRNPKLTCYRSLTSPIHQYCAPYAPINIHEIHPSGVPRTLPQWQVFAKPRSGGGLHLLRRRTPLTRRSVVYFCSGAHSRPKMHRRNMRGSSNGMPIGPTHNSKIEVIVFCIDCVDHAGESCCVDIPKRPRAERTGQSRRQLHRVPVHGVRGNDFKVGQTPFFIEPRPSHTLNSHLEHFPK